MTILQRYVLREILAPIGFGLIVFTFILLIGQIFQLTDLILNQGVSFKLTGELILLTLPSIMSLSIPMAILVGTLLGVGRLAADREILAIKAGGINLFHIATPAIVFAALISGTLMFANSKLIPSLKLRSTDLATQIAFNVLTSIPAGVAQSLPSSDPNQTMLFYFDDKDLNDGSMNKIAIRTEYSGKTKDLAAGNADTKKEDSKTTATKKKQQSDEELRKARLERKQKEFEELQSQRFQEILIVAEKGKFVPNIRERVIHINLTTGSIHMTDPSEETSYDVIGFDTFSKGILPKIKRFGKGYYEKSEEEMSNSELKHNIETKSRVNKYKVELYKRFSVPLACIAMALLAFPLAVFVRPTGKALAFGLSFFLILVYYGLLQYGVALGEKGSSIGGFAIFFPNILLSLIGTFLIYRMVRN